MDFSEQNEGSWCSKSGDSTSKGLMAKKLFPRQPCVPPVVPDSVLAFAGPQEATSSFYPVEHLLLPHPTPTLEAEVPNLPITVDQHTDNLGTRLWGKLRGVGDICLYRTWWGTKKITSSLSSIIMVRKLWYKVLGKILETELV